MDIIDHFSALRRLVPRSIDVNSVVSSVYSEKKDSVLSKELHSTLQAQGFKDRAKRGRVVNALLDFRKQLKKTYSSSPEKKLAPEFHNEFPLLADMQKLFNTEDEREKVECLIELIQKAQKKAKEDPNCFFPGSQGYRPEVLFYATLLRLNLEHSKEMIRQGDKVLIAKQKMTEYLESLDYLFNQDGIKKALEKVEAQPTEFFDYDWLISEGIAYDINKAFEEAGIFACLSTEGDEYFGVPCEHSSFTKKIGSIDIPVHNIVSLRGNPIGEAYAREGRVLLPLFRDCSELESKQMFSGIIFREVGTGEFDFNSRPDLIMPWIFANELSRIDGKKELDDKYLDHVLAEELSHAYSQAYTMRVSSGNLKTGDLTQKLVNHVLRPNTELDKLYSSLKDKFPSVQTLNQIATGFFEFEGQLDGLTNSPYTLRYFYETFGDVLFPLTNGNNDIREALQYDISRVLIAKFLTEEFLPDGKNISKEVNWDKLLERSIAGQFKSITSGNGGGSDFGLLKIRKAWLDFFNSEANTREKFHAFVDSKSLAKAASRVKERFYLTIDEREEILKNLSK